MPTFIVERYVPRSAVSALHEEGERVCAAAREIGQSEANLRYLRSIYVPDDEVCFFLFEGHSADAIANGYREAEVSFDRILEAEVLEP